MEIDRAALDLLTHAGRLMLQHNESSVAIQDALSRTARAITGESCDIVISYSAIAISCGGSPPIVLQASEIAYNNAAQIRVRQILAEVESKIIDPAQALEVLRQIETNAPRHAQWLVALGLAAGAAALAALLGADVGSVAIAAAATGLGLVVRQFLHRRRCRLLTLPFAAAFVAGLLGGWGIELGMTHHPGLALIVPCLMLVPGPHLINGLLDLVDNYIPMALARFTLAMGILLASSVGLLIAVELTLSKLPETQQRIETAPLNLIADMALAAIVTGAFALYYNTPWREVALAIVGGAIGHGVRSAALNSGWSLETATFLGAFSVGIISAAISRSSKTPLAVVAFAGAVTMMPGLQMYAALRAAMQLSRMQFSDDSAAISAMIMNGAQSMLVVAALGLGLIFAARVAQAFFRIDDRRWRVAG